MHAHVIQTVLGLVLAGVMPESQGANSIAPVPLAGAVRASDVRIEALIRKGCDASATFRSLVREVQSSNWIVYVQSGSCRMPGVSGCLLHRVGTTIHNQKYLRIVITPLSVSDAAAIATIGHELQHAVEVVRNGEVAYDLNVRDLFRRIGYVAKRTRAVEIYETAAAQRAGLSVLKQLRTMSGQQPGTCPH